MFPDILVSAVTTCVRNGAIDIVGNPLQKLSTFEAVVVGCEDIVDVAAVLEEDEEQHHHHNPHNRDHLHHNILAVTPCA